VRERACGKDTVNSRESKSVEGKVSERARERESGGSVLALECLSKMLSHKKCKGLSYKGVYGECVCVCVCVCVHRIEKAKEESLIYYT